MPPKIPTKDCPIPLPKPLRMTYHIGRSETGVLTFEPYKSTLLPLWRFKTPSIARQSSAQLYAAFLAYDAADDFVGMDMARKFVQMGMTRAKRYANYRGGRKYGADGKVLEKGRAFEGRAEKEEVSLVFREVLGKCLAHGGYREKKEGFLREQREWERGLRREGKEVVNACGRGKG